MRPVKLLFVIVIMLLMQTGLSSAEAVAADEFPLIVVVTKEGESLPKLAKRLYGKRERWQEIYSLNYGLIKDAEHIPAGTRLKVRDPNLDVTVGDAEKNPQSAYDDVQVKEKPWGELKHVDDLAIPQK